MASSCKVLCVAIIGRPETATSEGSMFITTETGLASVIKLSHLILRLFKSICYWSIRQWNLLVERYTTMLKEQIDSLNNLHHFIPNSPMYNQFKWRKITKNIPGNWFCLMTERCFEVFEKFLEACHHTWLLLGNGLIASNRSLNLVSDWGLNVTLRFFFPSSLLLLFPSGGTFT